MLKKARRSLEKLRDELEKILIKLKAAERQLEVAGNRWQTNHDKAHREHRGALEAERAANRANKQGHKKLAKSEQAKALRRHHRASKAHARQLYWVDKSKEFAGKVGKLKDAETNHEKAIKKIELENGPTRTAPNKVEGGTERQRLKLFMHLSMQHGSEFYSQVGATDVFHGITGPGAGHRHDCSSWYTSGYCTCGLRNPNRDKGAGDHSFSNGETMFTGPIGEHGDSISEGQLDTGDAILFGTAPFHHIEMKYGSIQKTRLTVGHGSSPIDFGTVDLLPGPRAYRRFVKS